MAKKTINAMQHTPGPTQAPGTDGDSIPNRSDMIVEGKLAIPVIPAQAEVMRRPFSEPTKPPMHRADGPGPDEIVSGRFYQGGDFDEGRYGPKSMEGGRRPTSTNEKTLNGQDIRGTC